MASNMFPPIKKETVGGRRLTHVIGIKNDVTEPIKITVPIQSICLSFSAKDPTLKCSRRKIGMVMKPSPQSGRLIQKIHRYNE